MRQNKPLPQRPIVRMSKDMELAIDRWRGGLPRVPNRAEAIRRLIQIVLDRIGDDPALGREMLTAGCLALVPPWFSVE